MKMVNIQIYLTTGANEVFPKGTANPRGREGANLLFDQVFLQLHENEKNWTEEGCASQFYCLDLPLKKIGDDGFHMVPTIL